MFLYLLAYLVCRLYGRIILLALAILPEQIVKEEGRNMGNRGNLSDATNRWVHQQDSWECSRSEIWRFLSVGCSCVMVFVVAGFTQQALMRFMLFLWDRRRVNFKEISMSRMFVWFHHSLLSAVSVLIFVVRMPIRVLRNVCLSLSHSFSPFFHPIALFIAMKKLARSKKNTDIGNCLIKWRFPSDLCRIKVVEYYHFEYRSTYSSTYSLQL